MTLIENRLFRAYTNTFDLGSFPSVTLSSGSQYAPLGPSMQINTKEVWKTGIKEGKASTA
jgi:hypothetical protein